MDPVPSSSDDTVPTVAETDPVTESIVEGKQEELLGDGTYARIMEGIIDDRKIAIKKNWRNDRDFIGHISETSILRDLQGAHPYIISIRHFVFDDTASPLTNKAEFDADLLDFAFDVAYCDLEILLEDIEDGLIPMFTLHILMTQMILAVEFIHSKGIYHRDIKPANFLIFRHGDEYSVQLADFGGSTYQSYQEDEDAEHIFTAPFRAPEILLEDGSDYAADIWALGCVFFELLASKPFIDVKDEAENDSILEQILERIPNRPSHKLLKHKRHIKLPEVTRRRPAFTELIRQTNPNKSYEPLIAKELNSLLNGMMAFDPRKRSTATEALNSRWWNRNRKLITQTHKKYPLHVPADPILDIRACDERTVMNRVILDFFFHKEKTDLGSKFTDRILFHAVDIFDRYMARMYRSMERNGASEDNLYDAKDSKLVTIVCCYIALKLFSPMYTIHEFSYYWLRAIKTKDVSLDNRLKAACRIEDDIVTAILDYQVYHPTLYEALDQVEDETFDEDDVARLMILYVKSTQLSGMKHSAVIKYLTLIRTTAVDQMYEHQVSSTT